MRIRIIKDYKDYSKGDVVEVSNNVAFGLIDRGVAKLTKDVTSGEYQTKKVSRGRST